MTTDEADRLLAACRLLGEHADEQRLLHAEVDDVREHRLATSHVYEVIFADGSRGAFKSYEGAGANAGGYNHTAASVLQSDVAAWLVACGLGHDELVGGVVLTVCSHPDAGLGSLQTWLPGDPGGAGWQSARQVRMAALFDALIGQQDRNGTNFNYDTSTDALGLFDNSFAFAIPGHNAGSSEILAHVHRQNPSLGVRQNQALARFEASDEVDLLEQILEPARFQRLMARADEIRRAGELPPPGVF